MAGQTPVAIAKFYKIDIQEITNHKNFCAIYLLSLDEFEEEMAKQFANNPDYAPAHNAHNAHNTHTGIGTVNTGIKKPGSIQRSLSLREGDLLAATSQELFMTLKNIGRKINKFIDNSDTPDGLAEQQRFLRLPMCQMYVGIAGEIRQTVKTMADIDKQLNAADTDSPASGLHALANAINSSRPAHGPQQQTLHTQSGVTPTDSENRRLAQDDTSN